MKPVAGEFISELNLAVERGLVKPAEASLFADWLESSVSEGIDGSIGMFESDAFESGRHPEVSIWDAVGNYIIKLSAESSDEVKSLSDSIIG
ncbi:MAG: hypothetical protein IPG67_18055 [Acidobacteria bacterium]|nr:hypothetical protein [Acidobacteriota bacterium]